MDAVIVAGGVAKGAFAAGALSVLLDPAVHPSPLRLRRIVGASAGALNGAYLASRIQQGHPERAGRELVSLWLEHASAERTFAPSLFGMATLEGFSSAEKILALLRRTIRPHPSQAPVDLRLVVTTCTGEVTAGEAPPATTFEHVLSFNETAFESPQGLERLFHAAVASSAFPGVFRPHPVRLGDRDVPCFDGGLTNHSPVRYAMDDPTLTRLFVIVPYPRVATLSPASLRGEGLLGHLADVVVHERLYRDLREARAVNRALARLEHELPTPYMRERVLKALGWEGRRPLDIVEIRPPRRLEGNAFDGFFSRTLRERYVRAGEEAARAALSDLSLARSAE